jgi:hypothetical protein
MVLCARVTPDLRVQRVDVEQQNVGRLLGGTVKFVGAMPQISAFIVALEAATGPPWKTEYFFEAARGDVMVVASDEEGGEIDLDVGACAQLLRCGQPDAAPEKDARQADAGEEHEDRNRHHRLPSVVP